MSRKHPAKEARRDRKLADAERRAMKSTFASPKPSRVTALPEVGMRVRSPKGSTIWSVIELRYFLNSEDIALVFMQSESGTIKSETIYGWTQHREMR